MESIASPASLSRSQFSLRAIFVVIGITCLLLAPLRWFGVPYLISATFSVILTVACVVSYDRGGPLAIVVALLATTFGFVIAIALLVFSGHAVLNFVACVILVVFSPRTRTFAMVLAGVMAFTYGWAFWEGAAALQRIRGLQSKYPLVSLADRLAFERHAGSADDTVTEVSLSPQVLADLNQQDSSHAYYFDRTPALRALHENYQREFMRAAGFGFMRMPSLTYRLMDDEEAVPLVLPAPIQVSESPTNDKELQEVHRLAAADYISPGRIGYVKSRDEVAGFESHRVARLNDSWKRDTASQPRAWQVVRLELVGLLRDEPRVYTAESLPPADQLRDAPHRPLNEFETAALPQLATQRDIVIDQAPDRIQMLGALRAGTTCIVCHECSRGKLLGAFSYEIEPFKDTAPINSAAATLGFAP